MNTYNEDFDITMDAAESLLLLSESPLIDELVQTDVLRIHDWQMPTICTLYLWKCSVLNIQGDDKAN